jgi:hypothetical protein
MRSPFVVFAWTLEGVANEKVISPLIISALRLSAVLDPVSISAAELMASVSAVEEATIPTKFDSLPIAWIYSRCEPA